MLVLSRRQGQSVMIGEDIRVVVLRVGQTIRLAIDAPQGMKILRTELLDQSPANAESDRDCGLQAE